MTRHVAIVTGSRAEWGHLRWLAEDVAADPDMRLSIVATGAHLSPRFGCTADEIEADGFAIAERVDVEASGDGPLAVARSIGLGIAGLSEALARLAPDILVILGDRYEMLAAAQAALVLGLPVAHLHGGETTEGAIDEAIRHAITKMAHLHFVAAEPYARRVVRMGEDPSRVFCFGAPGLDLLERVPPIGRAQLERDLGFALDGPVLLVTYHPATLDKEGTARGVEALVSALESFPETRIVWTGVNADHGNAALAARAAEFARRHSGRAMLANSLGAARYLGLMRHAAAVVGNSSSGIIEAPALGIPTVNVGTRQKGRLRAASIVDCGEDAAAVAAAIRRALDPAFKAGWPDPVSVYGAGDCSRRIKEVLKSVALDGLVCKRFHDG